MYSSYNLMQKPDQATHAINHAQYISTHFNLSNIYKKNVFTSPKRTSKCTFPRIFLLLSGLRTSSKVPSFLCNLQSTFQVLIKEFTPANRNSSSEDGTVK
ncbi:hypothetical protein FQA47_020391 [Oryzias melastigma]|uniref:Uncharacterized protein n=1 Tax=Oryzias melastigma TaxID=30732 RepID=A0A834FL05_ORYME|nr:hypothetical protein FQA47_020391 [Oryzias melastigma]